MHTPPAPGGSPVGASRLGLVALITANLIVAVLAVLGKWGYYQALLVYWLEAVVIGGYNVLRLFVVGLFGDQPFGALSRWIGFASWGSRFIYTLLGTGFFAVKFGGLALAVGVWVVAVPAQLAGPGGMGGAHVMEGLRAAGPGLAIALTALVVSHGFSFVRNFLIGREFARRSIGGLIFWPYVRMSLVVVVLVGGLLVASRWPALGGTTSFAVVLVVAKVAADAVMHRWEHRRFGPQAREGGSTERVTDGSRLRSSGPQR